MIRLVVVLTAAAIIVGLAWMMGAARSRILRPLFRSATRRSPAPTGYEWERRTDQLYRRLKAVPGPQESRDEILDFVQSRQGVEAYVEPRTVIHPLSVVLVAGDGEWVRFQLKDDSFIRELARAQRLRVHDAAKVGYPERMRRYRRGEGAPPSEGSLGEG